MALTKTLQKDIAQIGSNARVVLGQANALTAYAMNQGLSAAGVATGTTTSKVKTVNTFTYLSGGAFKSKGATDDFWTLSGTVVAASSFQKYALLIDGSGTASVQEATQNLVSLATVVWTNVSALGPYAPLLTMINGSTVKTVVGILSIATDSTHTFTPGTTLLGAAGITATFNDGLDAALLPGIADQASLLLGQSA